MSEIALSTKNLTFGYGGQPISEPQSLSLKTGQLICLLGPNGAGKSTLMRTLSGMQNPLGGEIFLGADPLKGLSASIIAQRLSVVLTERIDAGSLSAYELVALGRHPHTDWRGKLSAYDIEVVQTAMQSTGCAQFAKRPINELSDGERQKVMIARALAQEPSIMILDEPTAFLDLPHRVDVMNILRRLAHSEDRAILLSTHDLDLALRSADLIWLLDNNGRFFIGTPEDLVLNGAFAETFKSAGVQFDLTTGAFQLAQQSCVDIQVTGEGVQAIWVKRALERTGFRVVTDSSHLNFQVEILENNTYKLTTPTAQHTLLTIEELLSVVQEKRAL